MAATAQSSSSHLQTLERQSHGPPFSGQSRKACFPEISRPPLHSRHPDQVKHVQDLQRRLAGEPSPRHLGADVGVMEIVFDRGIFKAVETQHKEVATALSRGWDAIHSLPRDHLEWKRQNARRSKHKADWPVVPAPKRAQERITGEDALHENLLPTPTHPCGPLPCFNTEYRPEFRRTASRWSARLA
mmetsp:Transcript_37767/g.87300  ORF Transcript_37767/g.87300 Transcript_37767/m.87300 type:complete len:187 (-) Transcript_37767:23-583(-)